MKKIFLILGILLVLSAVFPYSASAQGILIFSTSEDEAKGKQIWEQLQTKQTNCSNLNNDDLEVLGEYFMGQFVGNTDRHAVMNQMMKNMMGQNGEEQLHIVLGKRLSGCDTNASFPSGYGLPMMWWMMGGGVNSMMGYGPWGSMMNVYGIFSSITWILITVFLVLGIVYFWKGISNQRK